MSATETRRPSAEQARGAAPEPSRLLLRDVLSVGAIGLRTRKLRAALSALGIAIGIASMVAVLSISASSQAELLRQIDALGTNLLTVEPGQSFLDGGTSTLPASSTARVASIPGVEGSTAVSAVSGATVRRSNLVDPSQTSGITVLAAEPSLTRVLGASLSSGPGLTQATSSFPTVMLGSVAAAATRHH